MPTHAASWQSTEKLLAKARALVPSSVAEANVADLKQFDDFLAANEFGLAFDILESIAYEDIQNCLPLLDILKSPAAEMKLDENVVQLETKIDALKKSSGE